MNAMIASLLR